MTNILACNLVSYRQWRNEALGHLAELGVKHVEIPAPAPETLEAVQTELAAHDLSATTLMAPCPLAEADLPARFEPVFAACHTLGARIVFVSAKAGDLPLDTAYSRLRELGDAAHAAGVTLALETHPDLAENGARQAETVAAIGSPGIGINFDTANIYFYNENVDALDELERSIGDVVSVHLKDTDGGYKSWSFDTFGKGIVDFAAIIGRLNRHGFNGPFTMEIEGVKDEQLDREAVFARVADSVAYLRGLGLVP